MPSLPFEHIAATVTPEPTALHLLSLACHMRHYDQLEITPVDDALLATTTAAHDTDNKDGKPSYKHFLDTGLVDPHKAESITAFDGAVVLNVAALEQLPLRSLKDIVVVGSSATGKTTFAYGVMSFLVNASRSRHGIVLPKRAISRPPREGDDTDENYYTPRDELEVAFEDPSSSLLAWRREMEGDRSEYYAFDYPDSDDVASLGLLSGNNDLLRNPGKRLEKILQSGEILIMRTGTPTSIRDKRLAKRSPDLSVDEMSYRLSDDGDDIAHEAHVTLYNHCEQYEGGMAVFGWFFAKAVSTLLQKSV